MSNDPIEMMVTIRPVSLLVFLLIILVIMVPIVYLGYYRPFLRRKNGGMKEFLFNLSPKWLRRMIWGIDDRRVLLRDDNRFRFYSDGPD